MILLYTVSCCIFFFYLHTKKYHVPLITILVASITIKGIMIALSVDIHNFDTDSYIKIGEITLQGISLYPEHAVLHHPYFPFFLYIEAAAVWMRSFQIDPVIFLKLFFLLCDTGIVYTMYRLTQKNLHTTLLYAINPVTLLITYVHGQFDVLPLFFLMSGVYFFMMKRDTTAFIRLSFAILTKTWPVLFIVPILKQVKNKKMVVFLALFPIISIALYCYFFQENPKDIIEVVKNYRSLFGHWGISKLFVLATGIETPHGTRFLRILFLVSFIIFAYLVRAKNIMHEILLLMLFFYCFTFALGVQYFAWVMPFLILVQPRHWKVFIVIITLFLSFYYSPWIYYADSNIPRLLDTIRTATGLTAWGVCLYIFFAEVRKVSFRLPAILYNKRYMKSSTEIAVFGSGCFWCTETLFARLKGVHAVKSGYAGGTVKNPSYQQVCEGTTGHAEVIRIEFDPAIISYNELLDVFWHTHDPTTLNKQGNDVGTQYRSVIFYTSPEQKKQAEQSKYDLELAKEYTSPIVTAIEPLDVFYEAEAYHQEYFIKNGSQPYCQIVIAPKVKKFLNSFHFRVDNNA